MKLGLSAPISIVSAMPIQKLTVYDVLVDLIPGSLLLLIFYPLIPVQWFSQFIQVPTLVSGSVFSMVFLLIAFATGHILQRVAGGKYFLDLIPNKYKIGRPFDNILKTGFETQHSLEWKFIKGCERYFQLEFTKSSTNGETVNTTTLTGLRWLVISYLYNNDLLRAQRWQTLQGFFRSMTAIFFISSIAYLIALIIYVVILPIQIEVVGLLVGCIILWLIFMWHFYRRWGTYTHYEAKALIQDFYTNVLLEKDMIDYSYGHPSFSHLRALESLIDWNDVGQTKVFFLAYAAGITSAIDSVLYNVINRIIEDDLDSNINTALGLEPSAIYSGSHREKVKSMTDYDRLNLLIAAGWINNNEKGHLMAVTRAAKSEPVDSRAADLFIGFEFRSSQVAKTQLISAQKVLEDLVNKYKIKSNDLVDAYDIEI